MKPLRFLTLFAALTLTLGCGKKESPAPTPPTPPANTGGNTPNTTGTGDTQSTSANVVKGWLDWRGPASDRRQR